MKNLGKSIVLTGIAGAIIGGLMAVNGEEEVQEVAAPVVTAGEVGSAPGPEGRLEEQGAQGYGDSADASTTAHAAPDTPAGSVQANVAPGKADPIHESTRKSRSAAEDKPDAVPGAFEEYGAATANPASRATRDAPADAEFHYSKIQRLYVLKGDQGYVYATFPVFLRYRAMIVEKMSNAEESNVDFTKMIYEIRAVGIGEETRIFVGDSWMDDGERSAELSGEELSWLHWAYETRTTGDPMNRQEIERAVQRKLEEQRDPAWQPAP